MVVGQLVDFGRILVDFSQIHRDLVVASRLRSAAAFGLINTRDTPIIRGGVHWPWPLRSPKGARDYSVN